MRRVQFLRGRCRRDVEFAEHGGEDLLFFFCGARKQYVSQDNFSRRYGAGKRRLGRMRLGKG